MKIYCAILVNNITGDIDHCITSDWPVKDEMIPVPDGVYRGPVTIPPTPNTTWRKLYIEFDSITFTRGRSVLNDFEMQGATLAQRANPATNIQIKTGRKNYTLLKVTNATAMASEHAARQAML